ncbi:DUF2931 family protein [Dyella acidiphila]|uniref:DUF2931 family protein n=1 Tax=Dyella acidiphila TaxID=2775866 RepID=A0ABR9GDW5_9GAMM|nr:DUF2931 family protein [Dyella acidiphila]MBE1162243.1 DUF2931 family protein [Dyella acidiphila]
MNRSAAHVMTFVAILFCLTACESSKTQLPYHAWRIGFIAPPNMEVWIEDARIEDVEGRIFLGYSPGGSAMGYNPDRAAWSDYIGLGGGRDVVGAALPNLIYVRWQSLVEPQTYSVLLKIPEHLRHQMLLQAPSMMRVPDAPHDLGYYKNVTIGLAPGGVVRVWITGPALQAIPMICAKAQVEAKGPYGGQSNGKYRPLTARPQAYLQAHPIPYGTWGC